MLLAHLKKLDENGMPTLAPFLILCLVLGSANSFGAIAIDFAIDASGGSYSWNYAQDPLAYERISHFQIQTFFREGTIKAERYCRQALGHGVTIEYEKNWISNYQESVRHFSVIHHSRIRCKRALELEEEDLFIGKYFDHARLLLSNFSILGPPEDNHQLVANTLQILTQIGAPAVPLLWDLYLKKIEKHEKNNYFYTLITIAQKDNKALAQVINIINKYESKDEAHREPLLKLFIKCNATRSYRWSLVKKMINHNTREMADDAIFTHDFLNNLHTITHLLKGLNYWMLDQRRNNALREDEVLKLKRSIQKRISLILEEFPSLNQVNEFKELLRLYQ